MDKKNATSQPTNAERLTEIIMEWYETDCRDISNCPEMNEATGWPCAACIGRFLDQRKVAAPIVITRKENKA
jgi:hypothetical protein